ncbi:MAG: transglutaminaseTgpA domain-containing protein, partial [Microcella sp.]|nr:transglutaminaseTgpA domain-containing protein [Microcella sp.]
MPERASSPIPQRRSTLVLSAVALLSVAAALTGFGVLLDEGLWGPSALLVASAAVAAAAFTRLALRRARPLVSAVASIGGAIAATLLALTGLFAADTALLTVVPLPETVQRFTELIRAGESSIAEQSIPAVADDGIRFLLASGVAAIAVLVDAAATLSRRPAAAAIPLLGMLAVPVILVPGALPLLSVLATGAAFLLLLALHRPAASGGLPAAGRAFAVAAGVLVTAVVVPPLLPPVVAGSALPGSGVAGLVTGINPVIELGDDLRRTTPVTALRYSTDADGGLYLTLSHLAEFTDEAVQPVVAGDQVQPGTVGPPSWLGADVETTPVSTRIELENVRTRWLPLPSAPVQLSGLTGDWRVNDSGVTISTVEGSVREGAYDVDSLIAQPTPEQLREALVAAPRLEPYRALPNDLDPIIAQTAQQVAAAAPGDSAYDDALALQRYFTQGDFVYSESAPVELGYDGTSASIVAVFLDVKAGYCVHYASAMTLMARTLGIPARIAVGFLPGVRNPDVPSEYVVSTDDLHAWPELHFDGIGWVRFEPTPSRGAVPEYASADVPAPDEVPEIDPETGEPVEEAPDSVGAEPEPDDVDRVTGPDDAPDAGSLIDGGNDGSAVGAGPGTLDGGTDARALAAALTALLVALVIAPGLWRLLRRAARLRSPDPLDHWREARDTARDLGLPADPERTP